MNLHESRPEIPTWVVGMLLAVFVVSFAYGIVVMQNLAVTFLFWLGILAIAVNLFVVYLLYRLVIAVEKIAQEI